MNEKYLSIGSIVTLKTGDKKIMVTGYYSVDYSDSLDVYDYSGVEYPYGFLKKNGEVCFNRFDIKEVVFNGFEDEAFESLNRDLKQIDGGDFLEEDIADVKEENIEEVNDELGNNEVKFDSLDVFAPNNAPENPFMPEAPKSENQVFSFNTTSEMPTETENIYQVEALDVPEEMPGLNNQEKEEDSFQMPHYKFDENGIIIN